VAVRLRDRGAKRRGDDSGDSGAGAQLEHRPCAERLGSYANFVSERNRRRPEDYTVRRTVRLGKQALLIFEGEDRAGMKNRPLAASHTESVLLDEDFAGGRVQPPWMRRTGTSHVDLRCSRRARYAGLPRGGSIMF
jgi:hypothetical protein